MDLFCSGNSLEVCQQFYPIPFVKQLTFYRSKQFVLDARYNTPDIPQANSVIGEWSSLTSLVKLVYLESNI